MRKSLFAAVVAVLLATPVWAHDGADHEDHPHVAPHGGEVRTVKPYHFELVTKGKQLQVYLLDNALKTLPVNGRSADAVLQRNGKTQRFKLVPHGSALQAPIDLSSASKYVVVISMKIDGKIRRERFSKPAH